MRFHLPASVSPLGLASRYTILFAALLAIPAVVQAGPNAGGTLIVHGDPSVVYTTDIIDYTGFSPLPDGCESALTNYPVDQTVVWWIKAAFLDGSSPRLAGVTFGVDYPAAVMLVAFGPSGDFELPDGSWPSPRSGTAVTFQSARTTQLVELYWFAGYHYSGYGADVSFDLIPHPSQGANFADDAIPSNLDPIAALGSLGFGGDPGALPCPPVPGEPEGACCFEDGSCQVLTADVCATAGGGYQGDDTACVPNPCPQPPEGACCLQDGACLVLTAAECAGVPGDYQGDETLCEPNPCPEPTGACCIDDVCTEVLGSECLASGGIYFGAGTVCSPGLCETVDCDGAPILVGDTGIEPDPGVRTRGPVAADVGRGHGVLGQTREETGGRDCGLLLFHADGSYENGYAWQYGGVSEPCFGAFAEGYDEAAGIVCSVALDLTQTGNAQGHMMDVYVWDEGQGLPGPVLDARPGVDPGQVAFWPSISRHVVDMNLPSVGSRWWAGYWGRWPGEFAGWYIAADLDGPVRGRSRTLIAPGIGYPTGWQDVSIVWGPTQSLGLGAEILIEGLGACCRPDGICYLATEATCGEEFLGEGTVCAPNPCPQPPLGACCFADGNCIVLPEFSCAAIDGVYQGDETVCEPNPCPQPPEGACCLEDGACFVLTAAQCAGLPGVYQGDDTLCEPNPCPQPTGACCFADGGCLVYTSQDCATAGGTYQGDHTLCQPNPCPQPTGACCFADGRCYVLTEEDCADVGAGYQGDHTVCEPNPCPQPPEGACCFFDGSCTVLTAALCSQGGGEYQGDESTCDPNPCPQPVPGACCFAGGSCLVTLSYECQGGLFLGEGTTCEPNPCETPIFGACCLDGGRCEIRLASGCDGEFQGAGTTCEPNPCPPAPMWACCQDTGVCQLRTQFDCGVEGGLFIEGYPCDPNPCPNPALGACCLEDGACLFLEEMTCILAHGQFLGAGTSCDPNPCPVPMFGACCLVLGDCQVLDAGDCATRGGAFRGDGTVCDPNPCPQPCEPFALHGRSSATRPTPPVDPFGFGRGGSSLRSAGPNRGGTLVLHIEPGLVYTEESEASYCEAAAEIARCADIVARTDREDTVVVHAIALFPETSSPRLMGVTLGIDFPDCVQLVDWQACADFELSDAAWPAPGSGTAVTWSTVQTESAVPVYWFAASGIELEPGELALIEHPTHGAYFADDSIPSRLDPVAGLGSAGFFRDGVTPCPVPPDAAGACCFADGTCIVLAPGECEQVGGVHAGEDVPCDPNPCVAAPAGACCSADGACVVVDSATCQWSGGTYLGPGTDCDPNPCGQAVGACCFGDGSCYLAPQEDCATAGGLYVGTGVPCEPDPCPASGACCLDNGLCLVTTDLYCAEIGGEFQGGDVPCDGDLCPIPAACCYPNGSCALQHEIPCEQAGGEYQGAGTNCDPNPCPQPPRGACCYPYGECDYLTVEDCQQSGGDYQGDDTTCEPNPCPQPVRGACCLADGSCRFVAAGQCAQYGGAYQGDGVPCDPNPCPVPTGACCFSDGSCRVLTAAECSAAGGTFIAPGFPCDPNPCEPGGTGCPSPLGVSERIALLQLPWKRAEAGEVPVVGQTGRGASVPGDAAARAGCGQVLFTADGTYENGYAWQYQGLVPPYFGAFAELYDYEWARVCAVHLDLTQTGNAPGNRMDLFVWESNNGVPGGVLGVRTGVDPGPIDFWPSVSRHVLAMDAECAYDQFFVGYWGNWAGQFAGWYVGADLDGYAVGCPLTCVAPGIGYPTGWQNVSIIWGPTQALGIGAEITECGSTPVEETSWGKIKALFR